MNQAQHQAMVMQGEIRALARENAALKEKLAMRESFDRILETVLSAFLAKNLHLSPDEIRAMLEVVDRIIAVIGGSHGSEQDKPGSDSVSDPEPSSADIGLVSP